LLLFIPGTPNGSRPNPDSDPLEPDEKLPLVVRRGHEPIDGAILSKNLALGNAKITVGDQNSDVGNQKSEKRMLNIVDGVARRARSG
jgi:hypothetical protein